MDFLLNKFGFTIIAMLLCAPIGYAQQSDPTQQPAVQNRSGNPLRLIATMPLAPTAGTSSQRSASPSVPTKEISEIPLEIRNIIYPRQNNPGQDERTQKFSNQENLNQENWARDDSTQQNPIPPVLHHRQTTTIAVVDADSIEPTATFHDAAVASPRVEFNPANAVQQVTHLAPVEPALVAPKDGEFSRLPQWSPNLDQNPNPNQVSTFDRIAPTFQLAPTQSQASHGQTLESLLAESNLPNQPISPNKGSSSGSNLNVSPRPESSLPSFTDGAFETDSKGTLNAEQDFQQLLQRVATSTCIVLFLGVGFILVAKRWMGGSGRTSGGSSRKSKTSATEVDDRRIRIVSNLKLNSKSNLHLLEIGDQRVLVASDLNGIKSIVSLNNSFSSALQSLVEEESNPQAEGASEAASEAGVYTPASRSSASQTSSGRPPQPSNSNQVAQQSTAEIEAEMQRKLSEILGGEAFKDVFYKSTRAVA